MISPFFVHKARTQLTNIYLYMQIKLNYYYGLLIIVICHMPFIYDLLSRQKIFNIYPSWNHKI